MRNEEITRPSTLIPYFTAYLIYYFYNSITTGECQKRFTYLDFTPQNTYKWKP